MGSASGQPRGMFRHSSAGVEFIVVFGLFLGIGFWVDRALNTLPGFMLLGGCIGLGAALNRLLRQTRQFRRQAANTPKGGDDADAGKDSDAS